MKYIFLLTFTFFAVVISANTGFNSFWEYAQSIGTQYLTNSTIRNSIINEPIQPNELIKTDALNAKFGALNKEITDLKNQLTTITSSFKPLDCGGSVCLGYITGLADGDSVEKEYLVALMSGNFSIVYREALNNTQSSQFNPNYYVSSVSSSTATSQLTSARVLKSEYEHVACSKTGGCIGYLSGYAAGETSIRTFLVQIRDSRASIAYRYIQSSNSNSVSWANDWDNNLNTYWNTDASGLTPLMASRILKGEYQHIDCGSNFCIGSVSGIADGESINKNFISRIMPGGPAYLLTRRVGTNMSTTEGSAFDNNLGTYSLNESNSVASPAVIAVRLIKSDYEHLTCGESCYGYVSGIADGESTPRLFLSMVASASNTSSTIVLRKISNTAQPAISSASEFEDNTQYYQVNGSSSIASPENMRIRVIKSEVILNN